MNPLQSELARFRADVPIEAARTPPRSWYVEPALHEHEAQRVFRRSWQYACPAARVAEAGSFARFDLLGESWIVVRDEQGELHALANVCRHHASELVSGHGCLGEIVCPYHGWTYGLDGRLKRAPRMGAVRDFEREAVRLPRARVETFGPLVLLHLGEPEQSFAEQTQELGARLDEHGMRDLVHHARRRYPIACNWKVYVDNYLDGGYHIAHLHKGLAAELDLDAYRTECFEQHSLQICPPARAAAQGERIGKGALYAWIWPNLMLNRYGSVLDVQWVRPLAADHCEVIYDWWFTGEGGHSAEQSLAASERVQREDIEISESVQRGLATGSYDQGLYAQPEVGMHHFHRMLAQALS
jgi:choline monooxygenase